MARMLLARAPRVSVKSVSIGIGAPPRRLLLARPPLRLQPPALRPRGRLRRAPRAGDVQAEREPPRQPLQSELAVARLAARVLRDARDPRPALLDDAALLVVGERARCRDVERRLDPRRGDVRMLPARAAGPAGPDDDLVVGDREARPHPEHQAGVSASGPISSTDRQPARPIVRSKSARKLRSTS